MMQILTGIVALVASGVLLIGGFLGVRFLKTMDPVIKQKTRNMLIEKMFEEARQSSIAQLTNHVLSNAKKLESARKARDKMGAMVMTLEADVDFNDTESKSNAKKMKIYRKVKDAYDTVVSNVDNAAIKHKEFEEKVEEYKDLERFTKMAGEAMALFDDGADSKLNDMLSLESFEHIDSEFNTAIVTIENNARDMERDNG
jgi:hypothetical protein